jgi:peptidoglycan/xylan/chitin deacetylase (PgdA/CDA1 family)
MKLPRRQLASLIAIEPVLHLSRSTLSRGRAVSLMYHAVIADSDPHDSWTAVRESDFHAQMTYLRNHFDVLSLDEVIRRMRDPSRGDSCMAAVCLDDAYLGNRNVVWPIVKALSVPITIFVSTAAIQNQSFFWFDRVIAALLGVGAREIDLREWGLGVYRLAGRPSGEGRWAEIQRALVDLKRLSSDALDQAVVEVVAQARYSQMNLPPLPLLSIPDIREMAQSDLITFGAHSHCHRVLTQLSDDEVRESVSGSKKLIEEWTGRSVRHFAYPHGVFNSNVARIVRECGFESSQGQSPGLWRREDSLFAIPRLAVGRYDSLAQFRMRVSGLPAW